MILTILFAFILLIGISLFVAVVGSAFLRRHSTRVSSSRPVSVQGTDLGVRSRRGIEQRGDLSTRYRREFEQRVRPSGKLDMQKEPSYFPVSEGEYLYRKPREAGGEGKWFLVTVVVLIIVIFSFYFGIRGYQSLALEPRLFFCEDVDFARLKPINTSDTFTRGNVTIFVRSRKALEMDKARVDIYRINTQGLSLYATKELPVKPEWTSFSFKALFDELGTYTVMVYGVGDQLINQENINIVPDSYAFMPVSR